MDNKITPPKTIGLDELAELTAKAQESERNGAVMGSNGTSMVNTRDMTPKSNYNPIAATGNLKPTDIANIAPFKETKRVGQDLIDDMLFKLDTAVERDQQQMWDNVISPKIEEEVEKAILKDDDSIEMPASGSQTLLGEDLEENYNGEGDIMTNEPNSIIEKPSEFNFEAAEKTVEEVKEIQSKIRSEASQIPDNTSAIPAMPVEEVKEESIVKTETVVKEPENLDDLDLDAVFGEDISGELTEEDDSDEAEIELTEEETKEEIKEMQSKIRSEASPISKIINLSEFKIGSQPVSSSRILTAMSTKVHSANWYLPNAGRSFTMSEISGSEIQKLDPSAETGLNQLMRNKELYSVFYDHMIDANKPATFEAWTKTVPFDDIAHLYFGAYRASFSHGSNLLPYYCTNSKCKHSFMEHKDISTMIKFKDDAVKAKAKEIMSKDPTTQDYSIISKLFQVSDNLCISFKNPSIYNIVFESVALPETFKTKFADLMYYIGCIDTIYEIDHANKKLNKMTIKIENNNINKTIYNKYKSYAVILKSLKADEYSMIPSFIKEIKEDHSEDVKFMYPETVCPKCGKKIEAADVDPMTMLFTRLRLQTILVL